MGLQELRQCRNAKAQNAPTQLLNLFLLPELMVFHGSEGAYFGLLAAILVGFWGILGDPAGLLDSPSASLNYRLDIARTLWHITKSLRTEILPITFRSPVFVPALTSRRAGLDARPAAVRCCPVHELTFLPVSAVFERALTLSP